MVLNFFHPIFFHPISSVFGIALNISAYAQAKIGNCKILGHPIFQGRPQNTQITTIKMYLPNEIKQNFHIIQCHEIYIEVKRYSEIDIFRNFSEKVLGVLRSDFWGFGCQIMPRRPGGQDYTPTKVQCVLFGCVPGPVN